MAWRVHVVGVLLALVGLVAAHPLAQSEDFARTRRALTGYAMDDSTIKTAVSAWLNDRSGAEATYGHISTWATGGVTDMNHLFCGRSLSCNPAAASFNKDISAWDTSGVTNMREMFYLAKKFNQDLGWCVTADVNQAFEGTKCASTSCGVITEKIGTCDEGIQAVFISLIVWACLVALHCIIFWSKTKNLNICLKKFHLQSSETRDIANDTRDALAVIMCLPCFLLAAWIKLFCWFWRL